MTRTIPLPRLSQLYGRAVVETVRSRLSSNGNLKALPAEAIRVEHPGISTAQLEEYRQLFHGEVFDGSHRSSLPSVLVHIAAFPVQMALMSDDSFPLPLMGMVHLSNHVEHRMPISAEQPLQILVRAENLQPHRRGTQLDLIVEIYPESVDIEEATAADLLWRGVSTYLGRGHYLAGKPEGEKPAREEFTPPQKTGMWSLSAGTGRQYAAVSGDYNPIHVSTLTAKALGMPKAIVHGMYAAGRMLEGREPEQAGHQWGISFESPMTLPGKVAFSADPVGEKAWKFTGWNPRKGKLHFLGELHRP